MIEASEPMKDFLYYLQTVKGRSPTTVDEYFNDLRTFFRFIKKQKRLVPQDTPFHDIKVDDVDIPLISSVTLTDGYEFMNYLLRVRKNDKAARARKTTSIKSFYHYLTNKKHLLQADPLKDLERPNAREKNPLPKYLTLEQSIELLNAVDGKYKERDYCILTFFLNRKNDFPIIESIFHSMINGIFKNGLNRDLRTLVFHQTLINVQLKTELVLKPDILNAKIADGMLYFLF